MTADGLYRASGNLSQIQKIRFQVNQGKVLNCTTLKIEKKTNLVSKDNIIGLIYLFADNLEILNTEDDIHVLTGALKMFFRELKEPLFPFNTFEKFLKAISKLSYIAF